MVDAAIGLDYVEADLHRIADRITTMSREVSVARGIGAESERLPRWIGDGSTEDGDARTLPQSGATLMVADDDRLRGRDRHRAE